MFTMVDSGDERHMVKNGGKTTCIVPSFLFIDSTTILVLSYANDGLKKELSCW